MPFRADLHIHSVLSPCAEREMLPQCIVLEALEKKIDIISVTDHNASDNVEMTMAIGKQFGVWVIPGLEIETKEEIHCLCYFPDLDALQAFTSDINPFLPRLPLDESIWGEEWVIEEDGSIIEKKDFLLARSLELSIDDVYLRVKGLGGVMVPSHVDRSSYSIIQVLGFIPPNLDFPALEISRHMNTGTARTRFSLENYSLVRSSDAHQLEDIGCATSLFFMNHPGWDELLLALTGLSGRKVTA